MKELEEERQIFLEECKKSKTKTIIISSIGAIIFVVILMLYNVHHVYGDFSGFTNTGFTMFNEGDSILDYTKIYFYLLIIGLFAILMIIYAIFGKGYNGKAYENYKKLYKKHIVYNTLEKIFDDVKIYDSGFSEKEIQDSNVVDMGTGFKSEDKFEGKYKDVPFAACDVTTWHEEDDDDGGSRTVIDFDGQYYVFEFNKKFKGNVIVTSNYSVSTKKNLETVEMENNEFNKMFNVYTDDQHLAYYILTPQLMEKIMELSDAAFDFSCAFIGNKIHIACSHNVDLFEFDPYEELNKMKENKDIEKEISMVTQIIDSLDLNNDLFK